MLNSGRIRFERSTYRVPMGDEIPAALNRTTELACIARRGIKRAREEMPRERSSRKTEPCRITPPRGPLTHPSRPPTPPPIRPGVPLACQLHAVAKVREKRQRRKEKRKRERETRETKERENRERRERELREYHERRERELREYYERQMRECREREQQKKKQEKKRKVEQKRRKAEKAKTEEKKREATREETDKLQSLQVLGHQRLPREAGSTALARPSLTPTTHDSSRHAFGAASILDPTSEPSTSGGVTGRNRASFGLQLPPTPPRPSCPPGRDNRQERPRTLPPTHLRPMRPILPLMALLVQRPPALGPEPTTPPQEPREPRRCRVRVISDDLHRFPGPCYKCGQPGHPTWCCPTKER